MKRSGGDAVFTLLPEHCAPPHRPGRPTPSLPSVEISTPVTCSACRVTPVSLLSSHISNLLHASFLFTSLFEEQRFSFSPDQWMDCRVVREGSWVPTLKVADGVGESKPGH
ncbi:hypothetical protein J6590_015694 [Homalodisca vitripennis]|nr:hypothetical protein J6590_015694 [Homalodisca vitripennis]